MMLLAAVHESEDGRYCCKRRKLTGDNFPARGRSKSRSLIDLASGSLPKSPVSFSLSDEVPHMFTRKSHPRLGKISINDAKRLLQQYRHFSAVRCDANSGRLREYNGLNSDMPFAQFLTLL